jgi:hypothetical protein
MLHCCDDNVFCTQPKGMPVLVWLQILNIDEPGGKSYKVGE